MLTTPFLARNITFSVLCFCMNEFAYGFYVLTERPICRAFMFLLCAHFLPLEQMEGLAICHTSKVQTEL